LGFGEKLTFLFSIVSELFAEKHPVLSSAQVRASNFISLVALFSALSVS